MGPSPPFAVQTAMSPEMGYPFACCSWDAMNVPRRVMCNEFSLVLCHRLSTHQLCIR